MIISLTITESILQVVAGIPKFVTLEANLPSSIFYTLDGTVPSVDSLIYVGPIVLPGGSVSLKFFATNGTDTSDVIVKNYLQDIPAPRIAHSDLRGANQQIDYFPFGDNSIDQTGTIVGPGGITVDGYGVTKVTFDGYNSDGIQVGGTDEELLDYELIFSTTDSIGQRGHNIGTLPANVKVRMPLPEPNSTSSDMNSLFFNPRALVIYQDSRKIPEDLNISQLNRQYFSTENNNVARDGLNFHTSGFEGNPTRGAFLRQHFNPTDQTTTYYYHDPATLRWIISKEPARPEAALNLSGVVFNPRNSGAGIVFQWIPFASRKLF